MSIYGTIVSFDEDHRTECAVYEERPPGSSCFEFAKGNPACTCGLPDSPLIYQGSHVLPSNGDKREGAVECADIPGFVTRNGREDEMPGDGRVYPWLRISVNEGVAVLRREHVERLRDALTDFLDASAAT